MGIANLSQLQEILAAKSEPAPPPRPIQDAQIAELRAMATHYNTRRFNKGDLVTPLMGSFLVGSGEPHIVLETRKAEPFFVVGASTGECVTGQRLDMRVLSLAPDNKTYVAHWVESWLFEPFAPKESS